MSLTPDSYAHWAALSHSAFRPYINITTYVYVSIGIHDIIYYTILLDCTPIQPGRGQRVELESRPTTFFTNYELLTTTKKHSEERSQGYYSQYIVTPILLLLLM